MTILILFGEMGCGKTYRGKKLAEQYGYTFVEGDSFLSRSMEERVSKFKPLTKDMVERFVRTYLYHGIMGEIWQAEKDGKKGIVVAQALYLDHLRLFLKTRLEQAGHQVDFVKIEPTFWRNLKQLWSRERGLRWIFYWLLNKPFFQKPSHSYLLM